MRGLCCLLSLWPLVAVAHAEWSGVSAREAEGLKVDEISFVHRGEKLLKNKALRASMRTQRGVLFGRRLFNEDLVAVINLYRSRGYREAQVARKRFVADEKGRMRAMVEIENGPLWTVRKLSLRVSEAFGEAELAGLVPFVAGAALDYGKVLEGERAVQTYLNRRGYPHARVRNEWVGEDNRAHSAEVVYYVETGAKMYFGEVLIEGEDRLHTRPSLLRSYVRFERGDLYDPEKLAESRNLLARTDLFRSVFLSTPPAAEDDSIQAVLIQIQERKYIALGTNVFLNSTQNSIEPRLTGSIAHGNWLGRGMGIGLNMSWGQPLQGVTFSFTERDFMRTGADLVISAGVTDEWSRKLVFGNPDDARQFDLLTTYDSALSELLSFSLELGADQYINTANGYISTVSYDYESLERLWQVTGALSRSWQDRYQAKVAVSWSRSRNKPDGASSIAYAPSDVYSSDSGSVGSDVGDDDSGSVDDLFDDDDFFGDDDFFDDEDDPFGDGAVEVVALDYFEGNIPVDRLWQDILTERSRSISFTSELTRDTRDDRIAPTRGALVRLSGLFAVELGRRATSVLDGEVELRRYQRLSRHFVAAVALQGMRTGSLRKGRALPQIYWKEYGGEGSLRGVERNAIQVVGGGRVGLNVRSELRFQHGAFGLAAFWDRAQVWRESREVRVGNLLKPRGMVDGYGGGLRYTFGFPFRLDLAFNDGFDRGRGMWFYFSIGQAF